MFYEMMLPLFILQLFWYIRFSKWVYQMEHLETLVQVLQCISPKLGITAQTKIQKFCTEARKIIHVGQHTSKQILKKLENLLQEISNDPKLRRFLGRHEPTIGGGVGINEAWSSAKMHAFLHAIVMWQNENSCNYRFTFDMAYALSELNANDRSLFGPNAGRLFRSKIQMIWLKNGEISTSAASLDSARTIALTSRLTTPRPMYSRPLNSPMRTPRQQESTSAPINSQCTTRISELSRSPPEFYGTIGPLNIPFFLQSSLLSEAFLQFLKDAHDLTGLGRKGNIWMLYDNLFFFQRVYGVRIYNNPILNCSFLQAIFQSKLIKDTLKICLNGEPEVDTLHSLTKGTNDNQTMFMDTLKMKVMNELWLIQNEGKVVSPFLYKAPQGVWKQDPVTLDFSLIPISLAQILEAA
jgi:hypothetical protein